MQDVENNPTIMLPLKCCIYDEDILNYFESPKMGHELCVAYFEVNTCKDILSTSA